MHAAPPERADRFVVLRRAVADGRDERHARPAAVCLERPACGCEEEARQLRVADRRRRGGRRHPRGSGRMGVFGRRVSVRRGLGVVVGMNACGFVGPERRQTWKLGTVVRSAHMQ